MEHKSLLEQLQPRTLIRNKQLLTPPIHRPRMDPQLYQTAHSSPKESFRPLPDVVRTFWVEILLQA
jgi:hypothetical protein